MWAEEELKTGTLSNGTVENYLSAIRCTKKHPIADRKLKTVTAEHLQAFLDLLTFGGEFPDGKVRKGYSKDYIHSFSAVLQQSFRFAVFPKQLISFNPMQYIKLKKQAEAEAYPGPSLIIAYAPCINHGIKKGMSKAQTEEQLAVECGYWNNFRFNPGAEGDKFFLDCKEPKKADYQAFLDGEVRYNALKRANPEKAEKLFAINEQEAMERYAYLKKLVDVYKAEE